MKTFLRAVVVCALFFGVVAAAGTVLANPSSQLGMTRPMVARAPVGLREGKAGIPPTSLSASTSADSTTSVIVGYEPTDQVQAVTSVLMLGGKQIAPAKSGEFYIVQTPPDTTTQAFAAELSVQPGVSYAEPNASVHMLLNPNDPYFSSQWGLSKIDATAAWDVTRGSDVKVGVIDTGVDYYHPDLSGRIDTTNDYDFCNSDSDALDDNGHGTHVGGILGATTNNGMGVAGVANQCTILPVKVLDSDGSGFTSDLADGIRWAADHGCSVISMSLGGSTYSSAQDSAIQYAVSRDCVVVAATGNDGTYGVTYPGANANVIGVGSTDSSDSRSSFSNYGPGCDIVAPGSSIYSTTCEGSYSTMSGTSMATPHVAGVVALIRAKNPTWTRPMVEQQLLSAALDLGAVGRDDYFGYGRVRADKAVGVSVGGTLKGTLSSSGAALPGATVSVPGYASVSTASNGTYSIAGITSGSYDVTFSKSGYVSHTLSVTILAGTTTIGNVEMVVGLTDDEILGVAAPASPIAETLDVSADRTDVFRVYLAAGDTLSVNLNGAIGTDFDVYLYGPSARSVWTDSAVISSTNSSYPEAFVYTAPSSGYYYLTAYAFTGSGSYSLSYSKSASGGMITGTVTSNGTALSGVTVSVPGCPSVVTASNGTYSVAGIAPATYNISYSKKGYTNLTLVGVSISSGATTTRNVSLSAETNGSLAGQVTSGGMAVSGATVSVPGYPSTVTASSGAYSFAGVTPGAFSVTFSKSGYVSQTLPVAISSGSTTTRNVDLAAGATDDDIPGVAAPASPITGELEASTDRMDVYKLDLAAGETISVSMTGASGTDFDTYLFGPTSHSILTVTPVAAATSASYPDALQYVATATDSYYVAVRVFSGSGVYSLSYTKAAAADSVRGVINSVTPNPSTVGHPVAFAGQLDSDSLGHAASEYAWFDAGTVLSTQQSFSTSALSVGTHYIYFQTRCDHGSWSPGVSTIVNILAPAPVATITRLAGSAKARLKRTYKLTGTVRSSAAPGKVTITMTRLVGGKWRSMGHTHVNVIRGAFSYSFKPKHRGRWHFVASYSGAVVGVTTYRTSKSATKTVKVR